MDNNAFTRLTFQAAKKGVEIVLPTDNHGQLMIEARIKANNKVIDREMVRKSETIISAAERMMRRMRKDKTVG